jgi:hypothetical protein
MNDRRSPTPEQVVETIKQLSETVNGTSPANAKLLEKWRELVDQRRELTHAPLAENCNEPTIG